MKVYVNYTVTREYSFIQQENEEKYLNILRSHRTPTMEENKELQKLINEAVSMAWIKDKELDYALSVSVEDEEGNEYTIYEY